MKPPIPIHDKRFKYVNAASTDLAETFKRVRKELALRERIERSGDVNNITLLAPVRRTK